MRTLILGGALFFAGTSLVMAQAGGKSLAATLDVYVFPSAGQAADQQNRDEAECYNWAVTNSGGDPFDLNKQSAAQTEQAQRDMEAAKKESLGLGR